MPHRVDIDTIHEDVFVLLSFAHASRSITESFTLDPSENDEVVGFEYYFGWLKVLLSQRLISVAIRTRILLDTVLSETDFDVTAVDHEISSRHKIGVLHGLEAPLTLRESFNKIIHAQSVLPDTQDYAGGCEQWTGAVRLSGTRDRKEWVCDLLVGPFAMAVEELLRALEEGVDWYHIHKYE